MLSWETGLRCANELAAAGAGEPSTEAEAEAEASAGSAAVATATAMMTRYRVVNLPVAAYG